MDKTIEELYIQLEARGLKGRVISISHLPELREEIQSRNTRGLFDDDFYRERLTFFSFEPPDDIPAARSVIIVAAPRPQTRLIFNWRGKERDFVLPPTYCGHNRVLLQTGELLGELLVPEGYRVVRATLPQKLLTVRSGLAKYGRNNITYIPGMGSFYQPMVFFSDLPCEEDTWGDASMMDRCQTCKACLIKCPTGAITEERFLLHAERCLVFHNERSADLPFPTWIDPAVHNCLMGCMVCQQFCPEDKPFLEWFEEDEEFSEEEASLLLEGIHRDKYPRETLKKLERLELLDDLDKLPRNLAVLLNHPINPSNG
jgi:epoxyqueuosine reductase